jgi:two-component system sensor histidine kinase QseC
VRTLNGLLGKSAHEIARERRFTSDAAHELRTPLTAITTHLQVARMADGADAAQALERAMEGASRLQQTLDALLTLSRVEGPFSWEEGPPPFSDDVVREAVEQMGAQMQRIGIEGELPHEALALPRALAVIALRNVLDNALRYSEADRPVVVRVARIDGGIRFTMIDQGPGLDESQIELAPRRFWREGTGLGSGLGLSIVEAITRRFGGSLRLARAHGAGLQVEVELPELQQRREP